MNHRHAKVLSFRGGGNPPQGQPTEEPPRPLGLRESYELIIASEGCLPLPEEVRHALGLEPGELLSLVKNPLSLRLDLYREFLMDDWNAIPTPARWSYLEEFLSRPLTAVAMDGKVPIPPDLWPLRIGETFALEIISRGLCHPLYLLRTGG
jgi:hypothetical protein